MTPWLPLIGVGGLAAVLIRVVRWGWQATGRVEEKLQDAERTDAGDWSPDDVGGY